ncbi:MAG TPA: glycosyl hydrolase family 28 protein [Kofleriaceae bacterium]|nr:glycosyl hydrolase family 28 protein [Kofleriaceae bacterium]
MSPIALSLVLTSCALTVDDRELEESPDASATVSEPEAEPWAIKTLSPISGANQLQINNALVGGGVVRLLAGTYVISDTIRMTSNSTLRGEPGAIIKLVGDADWPKYKPLIQGQSVSNVRITGLTIDGNGSNNTDSNGVSTVCGKYFYTLMHFTSSKNVEVDHSSLGNNWNDVLKLNSSSNIRFHHNKVRREGHDVVYAIKSASVHVYDNDIKIACNSGVRADGTKPMSIYRNTITRDGGGYAGIEIQGTSEVWACNNNIYGLVGPTIWNISGAPVHTSGCPQ